MRLLTYSGQEAVVSFIIFLAMLAGLFGATKAGEKLEARLDIQRQEDACFEKAVSCLLTSDGNHAKFKARDPMSLDEWAQHEREDIPGIR